MLLARYLLFDDAGSTFVFVYAYVYVVNRLRILRGKGEEVRSIGRALNSTAPSGYHHYQQRCRHHRHYS
ncbi:hypothetical protein NTE_03471 [Candidatus Nitrososphaera evergladensis SR1]|uniref:Uncharacterized protein n=1 Tax=Candidatus Nitrososphaera evergladensis SR1 TaxID=1459636 RepID=A0A075N225_9ARCH|nr:hypothetical protein NTE_03471 [Candidatus Nitrososphaera evergladensis SR1]